MSISPGSLPKKGILLKKANNKPAPIKITPKIINAFPIPCIANTSLFQNKYSRNISANTAPAPLPHYALF